MCSTGLNLILVGEPRGDSTTQRTCSPEKSSRRVKSGIKACRCSGGARAQSPENPGTAEANRPVQRRNSEPSDSVPDIAKALVLPHHPGHVGDRPVSRDGVAH